MSKKVHLNVAFTINEGKFDAFQKTAQAMVEGTDKEKGTLTYHFYIGADRKRGRLIETYEDAAALDAHFKSHVVQQLVPKLLESTTLTGFEIYGDPSPELRKTLADMKAEIYPFLRGINR